MTSDERATGAETRPQTDVPVVTADADGRSLPATRTDATLATTDRRAGSQWRQPVSVAYLPLALVAFIVLAFAMAMWTFLAATG